MTNSLLIIFTAFSFTVFSQGKVISKEEMTLNLQECQYSIDSINEKISKINSRVLSKPEDQQTLTSNYHLNERLNELEVEKEKFEKIKFSIVGYLSKTDEKTIYKPIVISRSDFEKYPIENQKVILENPDKYIIEEN